MTALYSEHECKKVEEGGSSSFFGDECTTRGPMIKSGFDLSGRQPVCPADTTQSPLSPHHTTPTSSVA